MKEKIEYYTQGRPRSEETEREEGMVSNRLIRDYFGAREGEVFRGPRIENFEPPEMIETG